MSMLYPSINKLKNSVDSQYTLCILAAKRSRDLIDGKPGLTECDSDRPVSLAAREIDQDLISYKRPAIALADEAEDIGVGIEELAEQAGAEPLTREEAIKLADAGETDILSAGTMETIADHLESASEFMDAATTEDAPEEEE